MSVKRGDVVVLNMQGRALNAIVLALRSGEVEHLGSNDEPLLSVAFSDPARETGLSKDKDTGELVYPFGRIPQIFIEHDVVHESHEFSDDFKKEKGLRSEAQIASLRGHGEWRESSGGDDEKIQSLRRALASVAKDRNDAEAQVRALQAELDALKAEAAKDTDAAKSDA
jgi:hypothetical protein